MKINPFYGLNDLLALLSFNYLLLTDVFPLVSFSNDMLSGNHNRMINSF